MDWGEISAAAMRGALTFVIVLGLSTIAAETQRRVRCLDGRRMAARNGFLQVLADVMKLMTKSAGGDRSVAAAIGMSGPLSLVAAFAVIAAAPLSPAISYAGTEFQLVAVRLSSGVVLAIAMMSLWTLAELVSDIGIYSKRAFLDALRVASTYLSIFLVICFSLVSLLMVSETMDIEEMVISQGGPLWNWYAIRQPLAFALFAVSSFGLAGAPAALKGLFDDQKSSRTDVANAGTKIALASMSSNVFSVACAALCAALFLGGWQVPFVETISLEAWLEGFVPSLIVPLIMMVIGLLAMIAKTIAMVIAAEWVRVSIPKVTSARLMAMGWRYLLPLSLINAVGTAAALAAF